MSRPPALPEWATDTNYPAGTAAWSATATKVEPTSGQKAQGAEPQVGFGAQMFNWLLNLFSGWITHHDEVLFDLGDLLVSDDFTGEEVDSGRWFIQTADIAIDDDSANGANGAVKLDTTNNTYFRTAKLPGIADNDFLVRMRVRWTTKTSALARLGLSNPTGPTHRAAFTAASGEANWQATCGATSVDTGVAAVSSAYQNLEIKRVDGSVTFYIDGSLVATIAYATSFTDAKLEVFTSCATASTMWVDTVKAWIAV